MTISHEEFARLANEGGASRSFKTGEPAVGPGVMVSVPGAEKITDAPTTPKEVAEFHAEHASKAGGEHYQGAWRSDGKIFHDVSVKQPTVEASRTAGVLGKQISGYDLGGTDTRRPEGGLIYYGRELPGVESEQSWKVGEHATGVGERLSPKATKEEKTSLANVNRSAKRMTKRGKKVTGKQVPVTINEVLSTIAKNRRNRGV